MKRIKKSIFFVILLLVISIFIFLRVIQRNNKKEIESVTLSLDNCKYYLNEETKEAEVLSFKFAGEELTIPKEINGYEVGAIDVNCFSDCYNLDRINIAKEVSEILEDIPDFQINESLSNEGYVVYDTTREYSELYQAYISLSDEEKNAISVIPNKYSVPISKIYSEEMEEKYNVSEINNEEIPSQFDLRDYINIEVENQRSYGNCYAFASLSSVETNLALTQHEYVDFSEIHAAILTTGYSGQIFQASTNYYSNLLGPVYEEDYPMDIIYYDNTNSTYKAINDYLSGKGISSSDLNKIKEYAKASSAVKYIKETTTFPTVTSSMKEDELMVQAVGTVRDLIKKHIMKYGSVAAYINSDGIIETYNGHSVAYSSGGGVDHVVSIVGWDDNYSKENFPDFRRPSSNGAYLVLNSWGKNWGENGYFWVSYQDGSIEQSPVGVVSVENINSNVSILDTKVQDIELGEEIDLEKVEIGKQIKITLEVSLNEIIAGNSLSVKVIRGKEYFTEYFDIQIGNIVNNKATIILTANTQYLKGGKNIIEVYYGLDKAQTSIRVINDFEYNVNLDGSISITKYIGNDLNVIIPSVYYGHNVYELSTSAFEGAEIKSVTFEEGIKKIGNRAFANCLRLSEINFSNSIISIGNEVFSSCKRLESINIPGNVESIGDYIFEKCQVLSKVVLNNGIKSIGNGAFYQCTSIENMILPNSVVTMGDSAFFGCYALTSITLSESLTEIKEATFGGCQRLNNVFIPDSVTKLGSAIFSNCVALSNISFSKNITSISSSIFFNCFGLKKLEIPENITRIEEYAFYKCSKLESVSLPSKLEYIGNSAFLQCTMLNNVVIPDSVTSVGTDTFSGCTALSNVTISNNLSDLSVSMFYGCKSLLNVVVPEGVTSINNTVFMNCTNLESVSLPSTLTFMGRLIFSGCKNLISVEIPKNVTTLDLKCFSSSGIKSIVIPRSVTSIGNNAFSDCTSLTKVTIYKEVVTLGSALFSNTASGFKLYCEENSIAHNYAVANNYKYHILENYEVIYNSNLSGTVSNMPNTQIKVEEEDLVLSNLIPIAIGHTFLGWNTIKNTSDVLYNPGDVYTENEAVELFAIWDNISSDEEIIQFEEEYDVVFEEGKSYIEGITPGETLQDIIQKYSSAEIYKDGEKVTDNNIKLATGMQIVIGNNTYDVVITGDITGDGEIDDSDLLMLARYMVGFQKEKDKVVDAFLRATDVYDDGEFASDKDLLKMARNLLK